MNIGNLKSTATSDLIAGVTTSIPSIPDAMASGVLAGINPINGLYGLMIGTPIAALFTGSVFMSVTITSAMSITIGGVMTAYQGDKMLPALVTIALVVGVFQLITGLLRLGFLVRFVSNAVMTGFLSGLGVLIVLSQLGDLTGYSSEYANKVIKTIDLLVHIRQVDIQTTIVGISTIILILLFDRTRLTKFSMLLALAITMVLPKVLGWSTVVLVGDTASIPSGFPRPALPIPILDWELISVGIAVAIIGLVQGAGISLGYPNPDGKNPDISRDFIGQGMANTAVSFFQGLPVGGSLSSTALVVSAGAKTRLANVFTGLSVIIVVLLFAPVIDLVPIAGLAAILVVAGAQSIKLPRIRTVWQIGPASYIVMIITFIATLILQIQYAVFLGVLFSFVMYVYRSAEKVEIVEIIRLENGKYEEHPAPKQLTSNRVTVLYPVGSLFFAGAAEFEEKLPAVEDAMKPVVILCLRGRDEIGSTFLKVLLGYLEKLKNNHGMLLLTGVSDPVYQQLRKTGLLDQLGDENIYRRTAILGDATVQAYERAAAWLDDETNIQPRFR